VAGHVAPLETEFCIFRLLRCDHSYKNPGISREPGEHRDQQGQWLHVWRLGGHFKTGQWRSPQNRPQDKCSGQDFLLLRDCV